MSHNGRFILKEHTPVPEPDLMAWARWYEKADRRVALTEIGEVSVSTVFLGLDHSFGDGEPVLFETLVFGGALHDEMQRYHTWEEALAGHQAMVERVTAPEKFPPQGAAT